MSWRKEQLPLQYSCLENSTDCIVHGVAKSWARLSHFHFSLLWYSWEWASHSFISASRKKEQLLSVACWLHGRWEYPEDRISGIDCRYTQVHLNLVFKCGRSHSWSCVIDQRSVARATVTVTGKCIFYFNSVQFSRSVVFDSLWPPWPVVCQASMSITNFIQNHVHWVGDAIQPSHPLSSPCPSAFNLSQYQGLFKWVSSSHQVTKVLEFQLQHQAFQWIFRLISFRMDWLDLLAVQASLKCLLQHHSSKFFHAQLSLQSSSYIHTWLLEKP